MGLGFEVDVAVAVLVLVFVVVVVVFPPPELWRSMTSLLFMTCRGCDFVGVVIAVAFSNAPLLRTMGEAWLDARVVSSNNEMSNENRKYDFILVNACV